MPRGFFKEVLISKAVYDEVVIQGRKRKGANDVKKAEWIKVKTIKDAKMAEFLRYFLNLGEAEAIVLAKEAKADVLLVDDLAARILARSQGIGKL